MHKLQRAPLHILFAVEQSLLGKRSSAAFVHERSLRNPLTSRYRGILAQMVIKNLVGAAIAAYDWLDVGIGTDTNGSIRRPAQCKGVFGLRPSQSMLSQEGMFTVFEPFDVPGIFTRDLSKLASFAYNWYGDRCQIVSPTTPLRPMLRFPSDLVPTYKTEQHTLIENFMKDLESYHNLKADTTRISDL